MAEFLTTTGISYNIENIIVNAKRKLFLISPYLNISKTLHERLKDASLNGVITTIIYGKNELTIKEKEQLENIRNLKLLFFKNLHAKCYFNEDNMVITSMNMYEFSEKNNREMGILVNRLEDKNIFDKARSEVDSIILSAEKTVLDINQKKYIYKKNDKGFCIRCDKSIDLNPQKPYCSSCFSSWAFFENYNFEEKFCHSCGKNVNSTIEKPLCYKCYSSNIS